MIPTPKFLYFDLGKVLVDFSAERMCRQMSQASGATPQRIAEVLFDEHLQRQIELGHLTDRQFYEAFCQKTGTHPDYEALRIAASDIFEINHGVVPIARQLAVAGHRMGILSNTCRSHWEHCCRHYPVVVETFSVHAMSFEIGACKPDAAIYLAAAETAGAAPHEIFFVDDIADNVAGAVAAGFDAVQYTDSARLAEDLRERGLWVDG